MPRQRNGTRTAKPINRTLVQPRVETQVSGMRKIASETVPPGKYVRKPRVGKFTDGVSPYYRTATTHDARWSNPENTVVSGNRVAGGY